MTSTQKIEDILAEPTSRLERAVNEDSPGRERDWAQEVGDALASVEEALGLHTALAETSDGLLTKVDLPTQRTRGRASFRPCRAHRSCMWWAGDPSHEPGDEPCPGGSCGP